jgi:integrase
MHRQATEFCLASMARPSEVSALTVGDVNRDTGAVRINKAFKYTGTGWRLGRRRPNVVCAR